MSKAFLGGIPLRRSRYPALSAEPFQPEEIVLCPAPGQTPAVKNGETVGRGALLAPCTETEPAVFAGIGGVVSIAEPTDPDGSVTLTVTRSDTEPAPALPPVSGKLSDFSPEALRRLMLERGIPIPAAYGKPITTLIVALSGDDPFRVSRDALCEAAGGEIVGGAKILMKLLSVRQAVFAADRGAIPAANAVGRYLPADSRMLRLEIVKNQIPGNEPLLLISALYDREIPEATPEEAGYTVVSPQLCRAVFEAFVKGTAFYSVPIAVAEEERGVRRILPVPFGTDPRELFPKEPAADEPSAAKTDGPSAMSEIFAPGAEASGKTAAARPDPDGGLVDGAVSARPYLPGDRIGPTSEAVVKPALRGALRSFGVCIGCGRCDTVCPIHLTPSLLYESLSRERPRFPRLTAEGCLLCGCCDAVCPSALPLTEIFARALSGRSEETTDEE